jgi:hypothetical protein
MNLPERRTTRVVLCELRPAEQGALRDRARAYGIELPSDAQVFVTETARSRGLLRSRRNQRPVRTALFVSPELVLIAVADGPAVSVLHARAEDVLVSPVPAVADLRLAQPMGELGDGVDLTGFPVGGDGTVTDGGYHLGLGAPDGDHARAAIARHLTAAPPTE